MFPVHLSRRELLVRSRGRWAITRVRRLRLEVRRRWRRRLDGLHLCRASFSSATDEPVHVLHGEPHSAPSNRPALYSCQVPDRAWLAGRLWASVITHSSSWDGARAQGLDDPRVEGALSGRGSSWAKSRKVSAIGAQFERGTPRRRRRSSSCSPCVLVRNWSKTFVRWDLVLGPHREPVLQEEVDP